VIAEELTSYYDDVGMRCERDAFDTLFDHAPDKLQASKSFYQYPVPILKNSLITSKRDSLTKIWYAFIGAAG
jgi:hypothetical protein